jgi:hypothetical protein
MTCAQKYVSQSILNTLYNYMIYFQPSYTGTEITKLFGKYPSGNNKYNLNKLDLVPREILKIELVDNIETYFS